MIAADSCLQYRADSSSRIPQLCNVGIIFICVLMIGIVPSTHAQHIIDNLRHRIGVFVDYDINFHSADFKQLPNVENCCPQFQSGSGAGWNLGLLYDQPVLRRLSVGIRLSYQGSDAELKALETDNAYSSATQTVSSVDIEHRISTRSSNIGVDLLAQWNVVGSLRFHAGGRLSRQSAIQYEQVEELMSDGYVFKENMLRTRNAHSGQVQDVNSTQTAVVLGASVEFPLNSDRTLLLAPEVMLQFGLSNLAQSISWSANACRIGVALKLATPPMPPQPQIQDPTPIPELAPPASIVSREVPALPVLKKDTLPAVAGDNREPDSYTNGIRVLTENSSGSRTPVQSIVNEELLSRSLVPLLGYIFFDENSSTLPQRYIQIRAESTTAFINTAGARRATMEIYHHVLNVIGQRMRERPKAKLRVVGCVADVAQEKNNRLLSRQRAEQVRDYLQRTWGLTSDRIRVESRLLPEKPTQASADDGVLGDAENRRVECSSDDPAILAPVAIEDTILRVQPDHIIIEAAEYKGVATSQQVEWARVHFVPSAAPERLVNLMSPQRIQLQGSELRNVRELLVQARPRVQDGSDNVSTQHISVEHRRVTAQSYEQQRHRIEKFNLILFGFDKTDLSPQNAAILDLIRPRINARSELSIEGFTDIIGDNSYNEKLSRERAQQTAQLLGVSNVKVFGWGERAEYDNVLPEGRFYNRTVSIIIDTPAE